MHTLIKCLPLLAALALNLAIIDIDTLVDLARGDEKLPTKPLLEAIIYFNGGTGLGYTLLAVFSNVSDSHETCIRQIALRIIYVSLICLGSSLFSLIAGLLPFKAIAQVERWFCKMGVRHENVWFAWAASGGLFFSTLATIISIGTLLY